MGNRLLACYLSYLAGEEEKLKAIRAESIAVCENKGCDRGKIVHYNPCAEYAATHEKRRQIILTTRRKIKR